MMRDYDRTWRNNYTDRRVLYGYDDGEGMTDWYDETGCLDSCTPTPTQDEQVQNDDGY